LTWGMSDELGPINYGPDLGVTEMLYAGPSEREYSEKTAEAIDSEVKRIMNEAYANAKQVIEENKEKLSNIAKALLKYETLDAEEVRLILEGGVIDKPTVTDLLAAEQAKRGQQKSKPKEETEQSQQPQEQPAE